MRKMLRGFVVMVLVMMGTTRFDAKAEVYDCQPISTEMTGSTKDVYLLNEETDKIICVTVNAQLTTQGFIWQTYDLITGILVGPTNMPSYVNYLELDHEETLANVEAYSLVDYLGTNYEMVPSERDVLDQLVADGNLTIVNRTYAYIHMVEHPADVSPDEQAPFSWNAQFVESYLTGYYTIMLSESLPLFNEQVAVAFLDQIKDTEKYATWSGEWLETDLQTTLPY